jgi:hypothetical protein
MTTPNQAKTPSGGKGMRTYAWPPTPPHEFEHVSVTSAIGGGLPKPFLVGWAAKMAAEAAVEDYEIVGAFLAKGDKRSAVDHIKGARFRDMGQKADRGTIVHAALESYLAGKKVDQDAIHEQLREALVPTKMWRSATNMIAGLMEFLFDEEPEVIWSEATVYSRTHKYAGTADLIARMRVGDSLAPVVLDVKTSKRIYDEVALQLCAYARADFVGKDDGTEVPLLPTDEKIEYGVVVRPTPSGSYEKATFALTDEVFDLFLACLAVATGQSVLGRVRRP